MNYWGNFITVFSLWRKLTQLGVQLRIFQSKFYISVVHVVRFGWKFVRICNVLASLGITGRFGQRSRSSGSKVKVKILYLGRPSSDLDETWLVCTYHHLQLELSIDLDQKSRSTRSMVTFIYIIYSTSVIATLFYCYRIINIEVYVYFIIHHPPTTGTFTSME